MKGGEKFMHETVNVAADEIHWLEASGPTYRNNVLNMQTYRNEHPELFGSLYHKLDTILPKGLPSEAIEFLRDRGYDPKFVVETLLTYFGLLAVDGNENSRSFVRVIDKYKRTGENGTWRSPVYATVYWESNQQ